MVLAAYTARLCKFNCFNANGLFGRDTNLVFASGNEECLLGTKAAFFDSGANLIPQLGGRVSEIA